MIFQNTNQCFIEPLLGVFIAKSISAFVKRINSKYKTNITFI